jgi:hypothetical protein
MAKHKSQEQIILDALTEKIRSLEDEIEGWAEEENKRDIKEIEEKKVMFDYIVRKFGFEHGMALAKAVDEWMQKEYGKDEGVAHWVECDWEEFDPSSAFYARIRGQSKPKPEGTA